MKDSEDIQKLIRLKRYETPGDAYYEQFLTEFKDRQRSEMLSRSSRSLLAERTTVWFNELPNAKWLVPAGAAAAVVAAGIFIASPGENENSLPSNGVGIAATEFISDESVPEGEQTIQIDLPKPDLRVPDFGVSNGANGIVPVGVRGEFREL